MTPNQQAVLNFLDALRAFHPDTYAMRDLEIVKFSVGNHVWNGYEVNILRGLRFTKLPATWANQARQAAILLQGDQQ